MKLASFILSIWLFAASFANASEWVKSDEVKARISTDNGLSVEVVTTPGWHIYYKDPGEAGWGTEFDFSGSQDFKLKEVVYPEYEEYESYGIKTNVYKDGAVFPVKAEIGENPQINLLLKGAVCDEICIPFEMSLLHGFPNNEHLNSYAYQGLTLGIILTAFLAGLILNIMPCVLPVLALKVLSVVKQVGKEAAHARINFLSTAIGIITSFLVLAGGTAILKSLGHSLGWGLHFQSPIFVGVLAVITFVFGLSLFGLFHMRVPSWISDQGAHKDSLVGNFMAGVLATLLGTACTAPVLVTAVSFALSGSYFTIFTIFIVMGIGMAAPYLLFALRPSLANFLPKPGKWMETVKKILGLMLVATAVWLGSILYAQTLVADMSDWEDFSEEKIEQYLAEDKTIFVDITAKWCVTCQANKLRVLDTEEIMRLFEDNKVILLRGDMTKPREDLLTYIKKYDRHGIPFNIMYGPNAKDGILLDTLLSSEAVTNAVKEASNAN